MKIPITQQLERIFLQKNISGDIIEEIKILAQRLQIPINVVPVEKLNYMINLLEEQQDQKTGSVTEEVVLYSFLGVFIILTFIS